MNKRGISAVVATVLIVLIVVAGAAFVWMGVAPVVDEIEDVGDDTDFIIAVDGGYTYFDSETGVACVQIKRIGGDKELSRIDVLFAYNGTTLEDRGNFSGDEIPGFNEMKKKCFNLSYFDDGVGRYVAPDSIGIVPIYVDGEEGILSTVGDSDSIPSGSYGGGGGGGGGSPPADIVPVVEVVASCLDGIKNQDETAVDCGGGCSGCTNGLDCSVGSDCSSGNCLAGVCVAYIYDENVIFVDNLLENDCNDYDPVTEVCGLGNDIVYNTLTEAVNVVVAGNIVIIKPGIYNEVLKPISSGVEGNPIIFETEGNVILDASSYDDRNDLTFDQDPNYGPIWLEEVEYIIFDGFNVTNNEGYVRMVRSHNITFQNNHFHGPTTGWIIGIHLFESHNNKFANNIIEGTSDNFRIVYSNNTLIEGNEFYLGRHVLLTLKCSSNNIIRGNYFYNAEQKNMEVLDCEQPTMWNHYNNPYPQNTVIGNSARYNIIENNTFAYTAPDSLRATPSHPNGYPRGPFNAIQYAGQDGIIRNNVFYDNNGGGLSLTSYGDEAEYDTDNRIYNNVFYNNHYGGIEVGRGGYQFNGNIIKNNILYKNDFINPPNLNPQFTWEYVYDLWNWGNADSLPFQVYTIRHDGYVFDSNNIINDLPGEINIIAHPDDYESGPPANRSLSYWELTYSSLLQNNIEVNPEFVDADGHDFYLAEGSNMIDAGAYLTSASGSDSGTSMIVDDVGYFYDGFGMEDGDLIQLDGSLETARIVGIDYGTNTLTLDTSLDWVDGQGVGLVYSGNGPDLGAFEFTGDVVLQTCTEQSGDICVSNEYCSGNSLSASDSDSCCDVTCLAPAWLNCADCGNGLFNLCDETECNGITEGCYYEGGWLNTCDSCSAVSCSDYDDSADCSANVCGLTNCGWDGASCVVSCDESSDCNYLSGVCGVGVCIDNICSAEFNSTEDVCRESSSECDAVDYCSGESSSCENLNVLDGTDCSTGVCSNGGCYDDNEIFSFMFIGDDNAGGAPSAVTNAYTLYPDLELVFSIPDLGRDRAIDYNNLVVAWQGNPDSNPSFNPIFMGLGNHDADRVAVVNYTSEVLGPLIGSSLPGMRNFREGPYATYPNGYEDRNLTYSFDYKNSHFIMLNNYYNDLFFDPPRDRFEDDYVSMGCVGQDLLDWLELDLQNTDAKFKFMFYHEGAKGVPNGRHTGDSMGYGGCPGNSDGVMRDRFWSLLAEYNATANFVGHAHHHTVTWANDYYGDNGALYEIEAGFPPSMSVVSIQGDNATLRFHNQRVENGENVLFEPYGPIALGRDLVNHPPKIYQYSSGVDHGLILIDEKNIALEVGQGWSTRSNFWFEAKDGDIDDELVFSFNNLPSFLDVNGPVIPGTYGSYNGTRWDENFRRILIYSNTDNPGDALDDSHVGNHIFDIVVTDNQAQDVLTMNVTVLPAVDPVLLGASIPNGSIINFPMHRGQIYFVCGDDDSGPVSGRYSAYDVVHEGVDVTSPRVGWHSYGTLSLSDKLSASQFLFTDDYDGIEDVLPGRYDITTHCGDVAGHRSEDYNFTVFVSNDVPESTVFGSWPANGAEVGELESIRFWATFALTSGLVEVERDGVLFSDYQVTSPNVIFNNPLESGVYNVTVRGEEFLFYVDL